MAEKFQGKYRVPSARLPGWDYGWNGFYFVTNCTLHKQHFFGEVENNEMQLSEIGEIASAIWNLIPEMFHYAKLDTFVVMPNHVHGIIIIDKENDNSTKEIREGAGGVTGRHNPMLHNNLSRILRWYSGRVSYEARKIHADFGWQERFHDHIIRENDSYEKISNYIKNNPDNWNDDCYFDPPP